MSSTQERVQRIVCEQLGVSEEEVTTTASFIDDLGADSLDTVSYTHLTLPTIVSV